MKSWMIIISFNQSDGQALIAEGVTLNKRKTNAHVFKGKQLLILMVLDGPKHFSEFGEVSLT